MADIIFAGFGGQGVLTAGKIIIDAAAHLGKNVSWTSSYGAEMRGGPSSCSIVISDEDIGTPYPTKIDILMAMDDRSFEKYKNDVRKGGFIVANGSLVENLEAPEGVALFSVNANDEAALLNNPRAVNIIMLGAMLKSTGLLDVDLFCDAMNRYFDAKGKNSPKNEESFRTGANKVERII